MAQRHESSCEPQGKRKMDTYGEGIYASTGLSQTRDPQTAPGLTLPPRIQSNNLLQNAAEDISNDDFRLFLGRPTPDWLEPTVQYNDPRVPTLFDQEHQLPEPRSMKRKLTGHQEEVLGRSCPRERPVEAQVSVLNETRELSPLASLPCPSPNDSGYGPSIPDSNHPGGIVDRTPLSEGSQQSSLGAGPHGHLSDRDVAEENQDALSPDGDDERMLKGIRGNCSSNAPPLASTSTRNVSQTPRRASPSDTPSHPQNTACNPDVPIQSVEKSVPANCATKVPSWKVPKIPPGKKWSAKRLLKGDSKIHFPGSGSEKHKHQNNVASAGSPLRPSHREPPTPNPNPTSSLLPNILDSLPLSIIAALSTQVQQASTLRTMEELHSMHPNNRTPLQPAGPLPVKPEVRVMTDKVYYGPSENDPSFKQSAINYIIEKSSAINQSGRRNLDDGLDGIRDLEIAKQQIRLERAKCAQWESAVIQLNLRHASVSAINNQLRGFIQHFQAELSHCKQFHQASAIGGVSPRPVNMSNIQTSTIGGLNSQSTNITNKHASMTGRFSPQPVHTNTNNSNQASAIGGFSPQPFSFSNYQTSATGGFSSQPVHTGNNQASANSGFQPRHVSASNNQARATSGFSPRPVHTNNNQTTIIGPVSPPIGVNNNQIRVTGGLSFPAVDNSNNQAFPPGGLNPQPVNISGVNPPVSVNFQPQVIGGLTLPATPISNSSGFPPAALNPQPVNIINNSQASATSAFNPEPINSSNKRKGDDVTPSPPAPKRRSITPKSETKATKITPSPPPKTKVHALPREITKSTVQTLRGQLKVPLKAWMTTPEDEKSPEAEEEQKRNRFLQTAKAAQKKTAKSKNQEQSQPTYKSPYGPADVVVTSPASAIDLTSEDEGLSQNTVQPTGFTTSEGTNEVSTEVELDNDLLAELDADLEAEYGKSQSESSSPAITEGADDGSMDWMEDGDDAAMAEEDFEDASQNTSPPTSGYESEESEEE